MFTIDQFFKAQKIQNSQMEAMLQSSTAFFEGAAELAAHNFKAGKEIMSQAASSVKALPQAGQFNDFMSKQAELMKPLLDQVSSFNAKASDAMEAAGEYMTPSKSVRSAAKSAK